MKAVILAGGSGTRLGDESAIEPKPIVEIGGRPILWHIMKTYSVYGINGHGSNLGNTLETGLQEKSDCL